MTSIAEKRKSERTKLEGMAPSDVDPNPEIHGILLSDQITFFAKHYGLIKPFDPENLKPAGYELTVGNEYFKSGEYLPLKDRLTLLPFEVAVIKTGEIIFLPRYLIARWNIRVKHAYQGLLWVGGPQVDPGYVGHLFCPIYNLSDKPVSLSLGEPLALMDFQKTTEFDRSKPDDDKVVKRYRLPPKRVILEDYGIDDLKSALFTKTGQKLEEFEESIRNLEGRFVTFTQLSFAIFGLVIAFLAISSKANNETALLSASILGGGTIAISIWAILLALFSYLQWRMVRLVGERYGTLMANRASDARRILRGWWWKGMSVSVLLALAAGIAGFYIIDPFITKMRQQQLMTKGDLEGSYLPLREELRVLQDRLHNIEDSTVSHQEFDVFKDRLRQPKATQPPG
jgi:deoxycytidine triphosphate deaminase